MRSYVGKNLALRYDFSSLSQGTIVRDLSGQAHDGEVVNEESSGIHVEDVRIYGLPCKAFTMSGGEQSAFVKLPVGVLVDEQAKPLEELTITCWVRVRQAAGRQCLWHFSNGPDAGLYLFTDEKEGCAAVITADRKEQEDCAGSKRPLPYDRWVFTAVTYSSRERCLALYLDGQLVQRRLDTQADLSILEGSTHNFMGYDRRTDQVLHGQMAAFCIYSHAMRESEVANLLQITDEDRVAADMDQLPVEKLRAVSENIALPVAGAAGCRISWHSSEESILSATGQVRRPAAGRPDAEVALTASLAYGTAKSAQTFAVLVPALPTDAAIVQHDAQALSLPQAQAVTEDLPLPQKGEWGSTITWHSADPAHVAANGAVCRPQGKEKLPVCLTAHLQKGECAAEKRLQVQVLPLYPLAKPVRAQTVCVQGLCGAVPTLPDRVQVEFSDGSRRACKVVWRPETDAQAYAQAGRYTVEGCLSGGAFPVQAQVQLQAQAPQAPQAKAAFFPLQAVTLDGKENIFAQNRDRDLAYLRLLDADRMLYNFRAAFGQDTKGARPLGGWDMPDGLLRGHSTGHFLSALALAYAATGDAVYREKLDYMIEELRALQLLSHGDPAAFQTRCTPSNAAQSLWSRDPACWGEGYISAYSPDQFALLEQYTVYATIWAPYYTLHKLLAGFLDCYAHAGRKSALALAKGAGDWVSRRLGACTPAQRSKMWSMYIAGEYGGMNESMARLYEITGEQRYLEAAQYFDNSDFFAHLARNEDDIAHRHANQHIPQIIGAMHEYTATGDSRYYRLALDFWQMVTARYAYSIGGVGTGEKFMEPYQQAAFIKEDQNCETCAAYNLLKLTRELAVYDPENSAFMDYYERTLINQIAASQNPHSTEHMHNGVTYMLPIGPGQRRTYSDDYGNFTCCHGTGMENHVKYQEAAYAHSADGDTLYVNLYLPSTLHWADKDLALRLETRFPSEEACVTLTGSGRCTLKLRVPQWAARFSVSKNGHTVSADAAPGSFVSLPVCGGDVLHIHMPFALRLDPTPDLLDGCAVASLLYGPLVMVAKDSRKEWLTLTLPDAPDLAKAVDVHWDMAGQPTLLVNGISFIPMYEATDCAYHSYFKLAKNP